MIKEAQKPWLDHAKQLTKLQNRGLIIGDIKRATHYLQMLGYYRLSGYFYPFRQKDSSTKYQRLDQFILGSCFDDAINLYMFDKQLRLLAFDALERIEMAIRTDIAHTLGKRHPNAQCP